VGRGCRTVPDMDVEHGDPDMSEAVPAGAPVGSDRLDDDAEALEDPVHAGDARHQHERHERDEPAAR
jgi:hypothetical protein